MSQIKLTFPPFLAPTHWLPSLAGFLWTPDVSEELGWKPALPVASRDVWQSSAHLSIPTSNLETGRNPSRGWGLWQVEHLMGGGFRKYTGKAAW